MTDKVNKTEKPANLSVADQLWAEIKNKPLEMFALPAQPVETVFTAIPADPNKLYLVFTVSAALPALETALGSAYNVELVDKYVVVSRSVKA